MGHATKNPHANYSGCKHPPIPHVQMLEKWLASVIAILEAGQSWVTSDTEDYIPWDGYIDGGTHMSRRKRGIRLG